jgi:hypothetical protein
MRHAEQINGDEDLANRLYNQHRADLADIQIERHRTILGVVQRQEFSRQESWLRDLSLEFGFLNYTDELISFLHGSWIESDPSEDIQIFSNAGGVYGLSTEVSNSASQGCAPWVNPQRHLLRLDNLRQYHEDRIQYYEEQSEYFRSLI